MYIYCPECEADNAEDAFACCKCGHVLKELSPPEPSIDDKPQWLREERHHFPKRWYVPLAQLRMIDVLWCYLDCVFWVIAAGVGLVVLIGIFVAVT